MGIQFSLSVNPDLLPLLQRFATADIVLWDRMRLSMRQSVEVLRDELAAASPRGHGDHPGPKLADSWYIVDEGLQFKVRNRAPQIYYVLKGNDYPHQGGGDGWIYPRNGKALSFVIDGARIVRRRVRATQPNDFVSPVRQRWRIEAGRLFATTIRTYGRWLLRGS